MARISTYGLDSTVTGDDKLIGTDAVTGETKNFSLEQFSGFIGSSNSYVHEQNSPSAVWTINHNLGRYPSIILVDNEDDVIYGEVNYGSNNTIIITLSAAISGKAFIN